MKWYDFLSNFYDGLLEKLYFQSRKRAIELLDVHDGQTIIDVACGTGANFKHIMACNKDISLYGTDYSNGMLQKGQKLIEKNNWKGVSLFQADARTLSIASIEEITNKKLSIDRILCVLGLSVIPDWEKVLDNLLGLLNEGGKIVVMDVFSEKRTFNSWLVEKAASADVSRKIWQTLETKSNNFYQEYLPVKGWKVGGKLFVATGTKK